MKFFRSQDMQRNAAAMQEAALVEPVLITYHDRPRLVLMSMEEYDRLRGRQRVVGGAEELPSSIVSDIEDLAGADTCRRERDTVGSSFGQGS